MDVSLPEGTRGQALALVLTLSVLAVLWFSCAQPLLDWYAARVDTLAERRALLQRMTLLISELPALQRESAQAHAPATALLDGATDAIAGAALQSEVQRLATAAGAELSSMETLPAEPRGAYRRIGLRVSTAAPWPVLVGLLQAIEQGPPRMLIDDVQMRAPPVELRNAGMPVSTSFTVMAFRPVTEKQQ